MIPAQEKQYSVLLLSGTQKSAEQLLSALPKPRFSPVAVCTAGSEARQLLITTPFDLIVINAPLPDTFGTELARELAQDIHRGVLLLVSYDVFDNVCDATQSSGVLTISKPCSAQVLSQSLRLLIATQSRLLAMEKQTRTLEAKIEDIRVVNRAKCVLIAQFKMDEPTAHRYIEKQAMNQHRTRREVAQSILMTYE